MNNQPKTVHSDYDHRKQNSLSRLGVVFEQILRNYHGEEARQMREDIANYTIGYMGASFGLHVK